MSSKGSSTSFFVSPSVEDNQETLYETPSVLLESVSTDSLIEGCHTRSDNDNIKTLKDLTFVNEFVKVADPEIEKLIKSNLFDKK